MEPDPTCDAVQRDLSAALDDGRKIPETLLEHAATCPACSAFLDAWTGGLDERLASPLPPAGLELRAKILALPQESARVESTRHRYRGYFSGAAAAVVLGLCAYSLMDVRPAGTHRTASQTQAEKEIAALKSDFRRGLAALREPTSAMQRILAP